MVEQGPAPLLIDTHYWIWLGAGTDDRLTSKDIAIVEQAAEQGNLFLSIMSVWEVGMLESKGRIHLRMSCSQWIEGALAMRGLSLAPLTPAIAIESSHLPGTPHGDPTDRIIIATARVMGARLLTADRSIRAYGQQHHVLLA